MLNLGAATLVAYTLALRGTPAPTEYCLLPVGAPPLSEQYAIAEAGPGLPGDYNTYLDQVTRGADPWLGAGQVLEIGDQAVMRVGVVFSSGRLAPIIGDAVVMGVNDLGRAVGSILDGTETHAFLFGDSGRVDIPSLGGKSNSATSINSSGIAVGWSQTLGSGVHAFVYRDDTVEDLGTFGGFESYLVRINDAGLAVGSFRKPDLSVAPMMYDVNTESMTELESLGGRQAEATDINNRCGVVGYSSFEPGTVAPYHAFRLNGRVIDDLGVVPGGTNSQAFGINDWGQVVGSYTGPLGAPRAFAYGIDPAGNGEEVMLDLNDLLADGSDWLVLTEARAIGNNGLIWGNGINAEGFQRAFVLTPL